VVTGDHISGYAKVAAEKYFALIFTAEVGF
jgi:hypothetical protein